VAQNLRKVHRLTPVKVRKEVKWLGLVQWIGPTANQQELTRATGTMGTVMTGAIEDFLTTIITATSPVDPIWMSERCRQKRPPD